MHLRGVLTYSFFYNLQLNGKHLLQVSTHCVGKHHEIQFKYVDMAREGHLLTYRCNKRITTIVCIKIRSSGILTENISLPKTYFALVRTNSAVRKTTMF